MNACFAKVPTELLTTTISSVVSKYMSIASLAAKPEPLTLTLSEGWAEAGVMPIDIAACAEDAQSTNAAISPITRDSCLKLNMDSSACTDIQERRGERLNDAPAIPSLGPGESPREPLRYWPVKRAADIVPATSSIKLPFWS
jgi:hypothetical protein